MRIPEFLEPGDIVDIVAPASASSKQELEHGIDWLLKCGFIPRVPKDLMKHKSSFFAATDQYAYEHLKFALTSKDSKAVWCLRGGYGSSRLLPALSKLKRPKQTKWFIGLSDVTALHVFLNQEWGWATLHAPILARMGRESTPKKEKIAVLSILQGQVAEHAFSNLRPLNKAAQTKRTIRGPIVGGNLAMVHNASGTAWALNGAGNIIFFEDVDERGYKVDRMLLSLEQAGLFKSARAVVFGDFVGGLEADGTSRVNEALKRFSERMKFPVLKGIRSGHGKVQLPVLLGAPATLIT